jgi:hypothetical protein
MTRVAETIFPLIEPPAPDRLYGVTSLNSNACSHFALSNAIGVVGPSALCGLRRILRHALRP